MKASKTGVSKYIRSAPGLALQETLKKRKVELELLTSIDMFLMIGKGGIGHTIHRFQKIIANTRNTYKNKEVSYLMYWDVNNLYGWKMS